MVSLEEKLADSYVTISPGGIDYSRFDVKKFVEALKSEFWLLNSRIGINVVDKSGKRSEMLGVFRPFSRRPAMTKPVILNAKMIDEPICLDEELTGNIFDFFNGLSSVDPPRHEWTTTYEGKTKRVTVTQIREDKGWWKGMFVDLYVNGQGIIDRLSPLVEKSKEVLGTAQVWRRYETVRAYLEKMGENFQEYLGWIRDVEKMNGEEAADEDALLHEHIKDEDIMKLLFRHSGRLRPHFFRNAEDYKYFLLAFKHKGFDLDRIHGTVIRYHEQRKKLQGLVDGFNSSASSLDVYPLMSRVETPRGFDTFDEELSKEALDEVCEQVDRYGNRMKSPVTISSDIQDLGFLVLNRSRWKKQTESRESYALIKVRTNKSVKDPQGHLPFKGYEKEIDLPKQTDFRTQALNL